MGSPVEQLDGREAQRMSAALVSGLPGVGPSMHPAGVGQTVKGQVKYGIAHTLGAALDQHPQLAAFVAAHRGEGIRMEMHFRQTMTQEEVRALYREYVADNAAGTVESRHPDERNEYYRLRNQFVRAQAVRQGAVAKFEQQHGTLQQWLTQRIPSYAAEVEAETQSMLNDQLELELFAWNRTQTEYKHLAPTSSVSHEARAVASMLVKQWAETSADSEPLALALQQAAVNEFQLTGTFAPGSALSEGIRSLAKDYSRRYGGLLQTFVRAQYAQTQAWLAERKITHLTLFRGMQTPDEVSKRFARGERADVQLQPVSSFSSDWTTANVFSEGAQQLPRRSGVVMAIRVPASQILSTARTGVGCLSESEVTVLGGTYRAWVTSSQTVRSERDFFMSWARTLRPELVDESYQPAPTGL